MEDILCNNIKVLSYVNTPVPSNTYLLVREDRRCLVIDPGTKEQADVRDYIQSYGLTLNYIVLTHEHFDHCWGVNYLLGYFPSTKVVTTKLCSEWVQTPMNYFNKLYFDSDEMYSIEHVDICAEDVGWKLKWGSIDIDLIEAKGHTNRGLCVNIGNALFSGDTMIYNTKPFIKKKYGGSVEELKETIDKIYQLYAGETVVYPGHGESFRLKEMKTFYEKYFQSTGVKR